MNPGYGDILAVGPVTVTVAVTNFMLVDKLGQPAVKGEGHVHYYLDVKPPTDPAKPATTAQGTFTPTALTSYTWPNVAAGMHTFYVQLVNNDHTPVMPPVVDNVTAIVR